MEVQIPSRITFTILPPEIRNMIYHLLLVRDSYIQICSPRRKSNKRKSTSVGILGVNKQIHDEANAVFYSANAFCVGNRHWGSLREENIHGLKAFIARVPARFISSITRIRIRVGTHWGTWTYVPIYLPILGCWQDASEVQQISRALLKHFKGLELIEVDWVHGLSGTDILRFSRQDDVSEFVKIIRMLMKHPNASQISIRDDQTKNPQEVIDKVLKKEVASTSIVREDQSERWIDLSW